MSLDRIPYELLHRIVNEITDTKSLRCCALTCRLLCLHAREFLFRNLALPSTERCAELRAALDRDGAITPLIQSITAHCDKLSFVAGHTALFDVLQRCPRLATLDLTFEKGITGPQNLDEWALHLPSLRMLTFGPSDMPCSAAVALISSCTSLDKLIFSQCFFWDDAELAPKHTTPVRRFSMEATQGVPGTGKRLARTLEGLQDLEVLLDYKDNVEFIEEMLGVVGGTVQRLMLSLDSSSSEADASLLEFLDLSQYTKLRVLYVHSIWEPYEPEEEWLGLLLGNIGSRVLEIIGLDFMPGESASDWGGDAINWSHLERTLLPDRQPCLRRVEVTFSPFSEDINVSFDYFCQKMPELSRRGLLHHVPNEEELSMWDRE